MATYIIIDPYDNMITKDPDHEYIEGTKEAIRQGYEGNQLIKITKKGRVKFWYSYQSPVTKERNEGWEDADNLD